MKWRQAFRLPGARLCPAERDQLQRLDEAGDPGFSKRAGAPPLTLLKVRAL